MSLTSGNSIGKLTHLILNNSSDKLRVYHGNGQPTRYTHYMPPDCQVVR